jgi:hypothetical protein
LTLDLHTGCLALPEIDALISPNLSRSQFLDAPAFSGAAITVTNEPWCSYTLPAFTQPETELSITLQFYEQQLLSLGLMHIAARFGRSWADWTDERELARKSFHEHWLTQELGVPPGDYSWGSISSHYDSIGGFSSITVRYGNPLA